MHTTYSTDQHTLRSLCIHGTNKCATCGYDMHMAADLLAILPCIPSSYFSSSASCILVVVIALRPSLSLSLSVSSLISSSSSLSYALHWSMLGIFMHFACQLRFIQALNLLAPQHKKRTRHLFNETAFTAYNNCK